METIRTYLASSRGNQSLTLFICAAALNLCSAVDNDSDVPIGGSLKAVQELEKKLGIELTGHVRPAHSKM